MKKKNDGFIRVIDSPHVIEIISERFDNALELMGKMSLAYGGAIRDILADLPVKGDLDIVVNNYAYGEIVARFHNSAKWTRVGINGKAQVPKLKPTGSKKGGPSTGRYQPTFKASHKLTVSKNPYKESLPIVETISFETFDNARVQLIRSIVNPVRDHEDPLFMPLDLARGADIRCCSLAANALGKIFELVDGAYIDCKDRVLRANKMKDPDRFSNIEVRVKKLVDRGWKSKINIAKIREQAKKLADKLEKEQKSKGKSTADGPWKDLGFILEADNKRGGYLLGINRDLSDSIRIDIRHLISDYNKMYSDAGKRKMKELVPRDPSYYRYHVSSLSDVHRFADHIKAHKQRLQGSSNLISSKTMQLRGKKKSPTKNLSSYAKYVQKMESPNEEDSDLSRVELADPYEAPTEHSHAIYATSDGYVSLPHTLPLNEPIDEPKYFEGAISENPCAEVVSKTHPAEVMRNNNMVINTRPTRHEGDRWVDKGEFKKKLGLTKANKAPTKRRRR